MQRKIPYVTDAQVGFFALQSKHILFSDFALSFLNTVFLSVKPSDAIGDQNRNGNEIEMEMKFRLEWKLFCVV